MPSGPTGHTGTHQVPASTSLLKRAGFVPVSSWAPKQMALMI